MCVKLNCTGVFHCELTLFSPSPSPSSPLHSLPSLLSLFSLPSLLLLFSSSSFLSFFPSPSKMALLPRPQAHLSSVPLHQPAVVQDRLLYNPTLQQLHNNSNNNNNNNNNNNRLADRLHFPPYTTIVVPVVLNSSSVQADCVSNPSHTLCTIRSNPVPLPTYLPTT